MSADLPPPAPDSPTALPAVVRRSWHEFLETYEVLRPELYRYCRFLTHSPWDAEDLAQDALMRAFVRLGMTGTAPPNPRAFLFRVASNTWIDEVRKRRPLPADEDEVAEAPEPRAAREAAGTLLTRVSPQERAAVVLKDVFDFSLEEVALALSTSVGAVKAALHRARGKLVAPESETARTPVPAALDAFCAAFNARDLERVTALLLETASVEVVGTTLEHGVTQGSRVLWGMMFGAERLANADALGGIEARFIRGALPSPPRCEAREHRGEWILLLHSAHADGEAVRAFNRVTLEGDRIARLRNYLFTPDSIAEVCRELDLPVRVNGYKFYLTGC